VVLVTGVQDYLKADYEAFLDRFKHYNPDAYIQKPVDTDKLLATIRELAGGS
jgi:hypothetical protein